MSLKKKALSGIAWTFAQQFSIQGLQFLVTIVMARLLAPAEFGIIGMITVFTAIGTSLTNSGLTQSLIRSGEVDDEDFSTVFYFNIVGSIFIYFVIFACAPLIADFYAQPILTDVVRVYCTTFVISAFSAVQVTRMTKEMNFKTQMVINVPSLIAGGILGIVLAYFGYGVWALVWMNIVRTLLNSIQLWLYSDWRPTLVFNRSKFGYHFNYGYKMTLAGILETVITNSYQIIIGRYFSAAQVGFYTQANSLKQLPVSNISTVLNKVTFPLFASIQNDDVRLRNVYRQLMQMVIFLVAPVLLIAAALGEPLFRFLLTEKWLPAVPYFQVLCLAGILYPIHAYNLNILKVKGRSDLFLKLEVIKKTLMIVILIVTIPYGMMMMIWGQVITSFAAFFINTYYSGKFINYSSLDQSKDLIPTILLALCATICIFGLDHLFLTEIYDVLRIFIGSVIGATLYLAANYLLKTEALNYFLILIKKK